MTTPTPLITPSDRIFVAGHRGMAGSAICRALQRAGYTQLLTASREELDLLDGPAVERWFAEHKPTVVHHQRQHSGVMGLPRHRRRRLSQAPNGRFRPSGLLG